VASSRSSGAPAAAAVVVDPDELGDDGEGAGDADDLTGALLWGGSGFSGEQEGLGTSGSEATAAAGGAGGGDVGTSGQEEGGGSGQGLLGLGLGPISGLQLPQLPQLPEVPDVVGGLRQRVEDVELELEEWR
jgi:hypothetical protein